MDTSYSIYALILRYHIIYPLLISPFVPSINRKICENSMTLSQEYLFHVLSRLVYQVVLRPFLSKCQCTLIRCDKVSLRAA